MLSKELHGPVKLYLSAGGRVLDLYVYYFDLRYWVWVTGKFEMFSPL